MQWSNCKQFIDDILAHHPKEVREQQDSSTTIGQKEPFEDVNIIIAVTQALRGTAGNNTAIVDFYSGYYGLVDRIDRY